MINDAEKYKKEDEENRKKVELKNELESLLYQTKSSLSNNDISSKLSEEDKEIITKTVSEHEEWLNLNKDSCTKDIVEDKINELQNAISPIMSKIYQNNDNSNDISEPTIDDVD